MKEISKGKKFDTKHPQLHYKPYIYSGKRKYPRTRDLAFILARSNKHKETPLQVSFPEPVFSQTLHNRETVKIRTERNFRELSNRIQPLYKSWCLKARGTRVTFSCKCSNRAIDHFRSRSRGGRARDKKRSFKVGKNLIFNH